MATIKQFNVIDRIGEIADGFGKGAQNYAAGVQQHRTQELQAEALRRQQAVQELEVESALAEATGKNFIGSGIGSQYLQTGQIEGLGEILKSTPNTPKFDADQKRLNRQQEKEDYEARQRALPYDQRDDYKKAMDTARIRANATLGTMDAKNEIENQQKLKAAQIADFDIADTSIIPTTKDAEEVKKMNASNKSFQQIGTATSDLLSKADPRNPKYYISNDWKLLNQNLTKMKLQAKNLEQLGVLNGPDLSLVNETLGDLNPSSLAILGSKAAGERLSAALKTANSVMENAAAARNYRPKGSAQNINPQNIMQKVRAYSPEQLAAREQELLKKAGG